jgi:hypothetical protein
MTTKVGIHDFAAREGKSWMPAFVGMTMEHSRRVVPAVFVSGGTSSRPMRGVSPAARERGNRSR